MQINAHWEEILRLGASIQQGTVTASLMLRKLGAYPRQNALATALRGCGSQLPGLCPSGLSQLPHQSDR